MLSVYPFDLCYGVVSDLRHFICNIHPIIVFSSTHCNLSSAHIIQQSIQITRTRGTVSPSASCIHSHHISGLKSRQTIGISRFSVDQELCSRPRATPPTKPPGGGYFGGGPALRGTQPSPPPRLSVLV